ncbi:MAG TPA: DNA repair protein RadC [Flavitalea sp.]|nr:DNA repair protein RadC [Flavitalea sp.]
MQEHNYSIKYWAKDDQPREKLRSKGAQLLTDSELIAILIGKGTRKQNAVELAKELLKLGKNNLAELGKIPVKELMKLSGIGLTKAITISAALEIGRRREASTLIDRVLVKSSKEIATYIKSLLRDLQNEVFGVVFLNRANRIKHYEVISVGGITGTVADPRIIFKKALAEDAVSIILFHNHPSGNIQPSKADEDLTKKIISAGTLFDIRVLDHIIVSEYGYFSFADEGLI